MCIYKSINYSGFSTAVRRLKCRLNRAGGQGARGNGRKAPWTLCPFPRPRNNKTKLVFYTIQCSYIATSKHLCCLSCPFVCGPDALYVVSGNSEEGMVALHPFKEPPDAYSSLWYCESTLFFSFNVNQCKTSSKNYIDYESIQVEPLL